jgi:aryl-alcohol dehydrogenase-like predicted oxidoreductase
VSYERRIFQTPQTHPRRTRHAPATHPLVPPQVYGLGRSEELIGKFARQNPKAEGIEVATKYNPNPTPTPPPTPTPSPTPTPNPTPNPNPNPNPNQVATKFAALPWRTKPGDVVEA